MPISIYWLLAHMSETVFLSARLSNLPDKINKIRKSWSSDNSDCNYLNKSISFNFFDPNKHFLIDWGELKYIGVVICGL